MITRTIQKQIEDNLFKNKVIVLYGARRTGKTTLSKQILEKHGVNGRYINCELFAEKKRLQSENEQDLFNFLGQYKVVVLDEAQVVPNIGRILKILVDTFPQIQIIATGSSSFDLANQIGEPLTGRSRQFMLYPLSLGELVQSGFDSAQIDSRLSNILRFGMMPSVFGKTMNEAIPEISEITTNYLYKDILMYQKLKKSELLDNLLEALALQLGNEVSYRELAKMLNTSPQTIKNYIELLEKTFVIFRLRSFARNPRNEIAIKNSRKIYFYDIGVRNSIIRNFNEMSIRNDVGAIWENFCVVEMMKKLQAGEIYYNQYFWRSKVNLKEIDLIVDYAGNLKCYEFKYGANSKAKVPKGFSDFYTDYSFDIVDKENYYRFLV